MNRTTIAACLLALFAFAPAFAVELHYLGTATGVAAIHYNDGPENPLNIAYIRVQASETNTNGAVFNFDPALNFIAPGHNAMHLFQSVADQFGLDLVVELPTSDGSVPTPVLHAYDNVTGLAVDRADAGPVGFGINGYFPGGPADPANQIINSLARGLAGDLTFSNLTQVGTVFSIDIEGYLETDGLIHWHSPGQGTTPFAGIPFEIFPGYEEFAGRHATGRLVFQGTLSYDSALDTTHGVDYYGGSVNVYLESVPEPSSVVLGGMGLVAMTLVWRRRSRSLARSA